MFYSESNLKPRFFVETNKRCSLVVEQFDGKDFNNNECGWTRNDISQLARAQSKQEFDMILSRLSELKPSSDGITKDTIDKIKPRYCQSPLELQVFAESVAQREMKINEQKIHEAFEAKQASSPSEPAAPAASSPAAASE